MLEHLFGSKTRLKLIRIFFKHPETPFFVRELTRLTGVQINAIRRELETLLKAGLVKEVKHTENNSWEAGSGLRRYYILDASSIVFSEIQALILKDQTLSQDKFVNELKDKGGKIKLLLITGIFMADRTATSDLLIVGELKEKNIGRLVAEYEQELGTEIRYTTMTEKEFLDRRHVMDKFLYSLFETKHAKVVNEYNV